MTQLLYFDPFNGASGDMILGALLHLGLPFDHLKAELAKMPLAGYELSADKIERHGLEGINFHVHLTESAPHRQQREHRHAEDDDTGHHHHHRGFHDIRELIESSRLDPWVKEKSVAIFRRLGEAEAKVHRTSLDKVHFHEVGAVDSIVDIVGACIGFKYFGVERFCTAALNLGSGTVRFSHGAWPVPTPATAELVAGFPVLQGQIQGELTTPTGAAIVTTLVERDQSPPVCVYEKWGFGAGDREFEEIPNMLRLILGSVARKEAENSQAWQQEEICLLEANIDDMDAEMFGHFMEVALENGALDVYYTPLQMKKNRPGLKLSVLCRNEDRERMAELIFKETTTLGVRWSAWKRWILDREIKQIETELGKVRVKIARLQGRVISVSLEYDDLKALAEQAKIPLKTVRRKIMGNIADHYD